MGFIKHLLVASLTISARSEVAAARINRKGEEAKKLCRAQKWEIWKVWHLPWGGPCRFPWRPPYLQTLLYNLIFFFSECSASWNALCGSRYWTPRLHSKSEDGQNAQYSVLCRPRQTVPFTSTSNVSFCFLHHYLSSVFLCCPSCKEQNEVYILLSTIPSSQQPCCSVGLTERDWAAQGHSARFTAEQRIEF